MKTVIDQIRTDALSLTASERASLAHDLILSLDKADDLSLDEKQEKEIRRRIRMVKSGKAKTQTAERVFEEIEEKY